MANKGGVYKIVNGKPELDLSVEQTTRRVGDDIESNAEPENLDSVSTTDKLETPKNGRSKTTDS